MERKKIDRNDIEAVIKGDTNITQFLEINPGEGIMSKFGVRTSRNPNYLHRSMYEMYERSLNRKLTIQMIRKLYRSVGMGASGLNIFLKKTGPGSETSRVPPVRIQVVAPAGVGSTPGNCIVK
jgi:hypothetical protein